VFERIGWKYFERVTKLELVSDYSITISTIIRDHESGSHYAGTPGYAGFLKPLSWVKDRNLPCETTMLD